MLVRSCYISLQRQVAEDILFYVHRCQNLRTQDSSIMKKGANISSEALIIIFETTEITSSKTVNFIVTSLNLKRHRIYVIGEVTPHSVTILHSTPRHEVPSQGWWHVPVYTAPIIFMDATAVTFYTHYSTTAKLSAPAPLQFRNSLTGLKFYLTNFTVRFSRKSKDTQSERER
jgi:hypothetical protein